MALPSPSPLCGRCGTRPAAPGNGIRSEVRIPVGSRKRYEGEHTLVLELELCEPCGLASFKHQKRYFGVRLYRPASP